MKFGLITVAMVLASSSAQTAEPKNNTVVEVEQELNEIIEDEQGLLHQEIELLTALTAEDVPLEAMMTVTSEATEEMITEHDDVPAPAADEAHHESNHQHKKSEKARAKAAKEAKAAGHHSESKSSKKHDTEALSIMSVAVHTKQTKSSKTHLMATMMAEEEHYSMVYEAKSAKSTDAHSMPTDHVVYKAKSAKSKSAKAKSSKAHIIMSMPHESLDHSMPMAKSAKAHVEPSKAAKVAPQLLTKAHKSVKSAKSVKSGKKTKTHQHRVDDESLSMITHAHGKSHKGHHAGDTTTDEEDATMETHDGGVTNGSDNNGGDTTLETADGIAPDSDNGTSSSSMMMTPAMGEVKDVILNGDGTKPVVRAPDVKPHHGADTSKLQNEKFTQEVKGVLLHGEKAIKGHNKKQNVDALDMGDGGNGGNQGAESSLVASTSNVNSSATVRGVMVGGICLLATSMYYAMFA